MLSTDHADAPSNVGLVAFPGVLGFCLGDARRNILAPHNYEFFWVNMMKLRRSHASAFPPNANPGIYCATESEGGKQTEANMADCGVN